MWLTADKAGVVEIQTTQDADPVWIEMDAVPLLVCDMWEHAYDRDWRGDRVGYVSEFIHRWANWPMASTQFLAARRGEFGWRHP